MDQEERGNGADSLRKRGRRYLIILWSGMLVAIVGGVLGSLYEQEINQSPVLLALMIILMVPIGIISITLLIEIVKRLRWWLLLPVGLSVILPWVSIITIPLLLISYLAFLTYEHARLLRE